MGDEAGVHIEVVAPASEPLQPSDVRTGGAGFIPPVKVREDAVVSPEDAVDFTSAVPLSVGGPSWPRESRNLAWMGCKAVFGTEITGVRTGRWGQGILAGQTAFGHGVHWAWPQSTQGVVDCPPRGVRASLSWPFPL